MYVQKHTSHTISWSSADTFPPLLKFRNAEFYVCVCFVRRNTCPPWCPAQVTDSFKCFIEHGDNWHSGTGVAMETDGTIASPWSGLHFLALSGGACVSASGIWVRWWTIFIQIFARNPFIHLGINRVSSWVTVKQKPGISLILWSGDAVSFVAPSVPWYLP